MQRLALFDFDGVLADTLDEMVRFARLAGARIGFTTQPAPSDLEALEVMDMISYGRQLGLPEGKLALFADTLREFFLSNPEPIRVFPGIREAIASLSRDWLIAVVTGNARELVVDFLHQHGLQDAVRLIYSGDMPGTRQHKILKAMRDSGAPSQQTCLVSDAVSDIREAREAGIHSVAVTWGYQSREKLATRHPDAIAVSPGELKDILDQLCKLQKV